MPVTLLCPNLRCRAILQVPDTCRGRKVRCGQCGITLSVPSSGHSAMPTAADAETASAGPSPDGKDKGKGIGKSKR